LRGLNPIFMDPWEPLPGKKNDDKAEGWLYNSDGISKDDRNYPDWDLIRRHMGYTLDFADRLNMNRMIPHSELSSTTYCLADVGQEYLIYFPDGGEAKINLQNGEGKYKATWFIPLINKTIVAPKQITGGAIVQMESPTSLDAVLHLIRN
jgi:hypothetical protein